MASEPVGTIVNVTDSKASALAAFQRAKSDFLASLTTDEQASITQCSSPEDLLKEVDDMCKSKKIRYVRSRGGRAAEVIERFAESFRPYFHVVNTLIQSHPEFAALAWGSVKFLLQLTSNFATFFAKLTEFLNEIAIRLPSYEDILSIPGLELSSRFVTSLEHIYIDLLKFFQKVIFMFRRPNGDSRSSLHVLGSLAWTSFGDRFQITLDQLKLHSEILKQELHITHLRTTGKLVELQKQELQFREKQAGRIKPDGIDDKSAQVKPEENRELIGKKFRHMVKWLSPPHFTRPFEKARDVREQGTSEWLFENKLYKAWEMSDANSTADDQLFDQNALWIRGIPGAGKTVLAAAAVDRLRTISGGNSSCVLYHFFSMKDQGFETSDGAQRSILAQLLVYHSRFRELLDIFEFAMADVSFDPLAASFGVVQDIFRLAIPLIDITIVLDGVDECLDAEVMVKNLVTIKSDRCFKILLFSRPAGLNFATLPRAMSKSGCIDIGKSTNADIYLFLQRQLEMIKLDGLLGQEIIVDSLVNHLITGADGMFLWARLMVSHLSSVALTPVQRIRIINDVTSPEGLDKMYQRILERIHQTSSVEQNLAENVLMWVISARRPLTEFELHEGVKMSIGLQSDDSGYQDFLHVVLTVCPGLIELRATDTVDGRSMVFYVTHSTVRDHCLPLVEACGGDERWRVSTANHDVRQRLCNVKITTVCLRYLTNSVPAQPLSGDLKTDAVRRDVNTTFPLCDYAASFWIDHLFTTKQDLFKKSSGDSLRVEHYSDIMTALACWLSQKLVVMAWIEASYVSGRSPNFKDLRHWVFWASSSQHQQNTNSQATLADALELSHDLERLRVDWDYALRKSPRKIWNEVASFTPSRFFAENTGIRYQAFAVDALPSDIMSSKFLCKASQANHTDQIVGVLSVWPSRAFETFVEEDRSLGGWSEIKNFSSGWCARYEIWSIKSTPLRLCDTQIPLDKDEVCLQLRQSASKRFECTWKVQFPIAIAPDARSFVLLRTIYTSQSTPNKHRMNLLSARFPVSYDQGVQYRWSLEYAMTNTLGTFDFYFYNLMISDDGRYLFMIDQFGILNNLAVFELAATGALSVTLVNHLRTENFTRMEDLWSHKCKFAFHPYALIIAISIPGNCFLWNFSDVNIYIPRVGDMKSLELKRLYQISDVSFTEDGKMIVKNQKSNYPEIWETGLKGKQVRTTLNTPASTELLRTNGKEALQLSSLSESGCTIRPGMALINSSDNIIGQTSITSGSIQLQYSTVSKNDDGSAIHDRPTVFKAATLPMWPAVNTTAASIAWPESKDDLVRIVLDKTPQQWYGLDGPMDQHFPAVIDQDRRLWDHSNVQKETPKLIPNLPLPATHLSGESIPQGRSILDVDASPESGCRLVENATNGLPKQDETQDENNTTPNAESSSRARRSGFSRLLYSLKKIFPCNR